jgi:hypothetical protein
MTIHRASSTVGEAERDFQRIVGDLLHPDGERGFNLWADAPHPVMLIWSPRIYEFLRVLENVMSYPPARGLCREVGYRSGLDGAVASRKALAIGEDGRVELLLAMPRVLAGAGWGVSELVYDDEGGEIAWTFPKGTAVGVAAQGQDARTDPACAFFEGFGAGWVKGSVGLDVEFFESACLGLGNDACRFESRPLR